MTRFTLLCTCTMALGGCGLRAADEPTPAARAADVTLGAEGGVLALEGLRFVVPSGALPAGTRLEVAVVDEQPALPEVTLVTPVFEFGPAGTTFDVEVFVSFEVPGLAEDAIPVVYWTNVAGEFEPQPSWTAEGKVHALTTHLSRAFVGTSKSAPKTLSCGLDRGQCMHGRCFCMPGARLVEKEIGNAEVVEAEGLEVRSLGGGASSKSKIVVRQTPVRPGALGIASAGPVYDVGGTIGEGARIELCLKAGPGAEKPGGACLGYLDEKTATWKCEDECLQSNGDLLCGVTSHFTNFAILLNPGKSGGCDDEDAFFRNCPRGQTLCADGACHESCEGICAAGERLCADGQCHASCEGVCSARQSLCADGLCHESCEGICAAGQQVCADGQCHLSCKGICATGQTLCADGQCVAEAAQCEKTCASGQRRCPDGTCATTCEEPPCGLGELLCPDGVTCAPELESCP